MRKTWGRPGSCYRWNMVVIARPYDLPYVPIRKSDDLRNHFAKSQIFEGLLAQSVAMQIISTLTINRRKGRSTAWAGWAMFPLLIGLPIFVRNKIGHSGRHLGIPASPANICTAR